MPRVFPHDLEAERSLLGSMLISKEACQDILNKCEDRDFYEESHKVLFNAMSELSRQNIPVDVTTITSYLLDHSQLDKVGGVEYLRQLSDSVPTLAHSEYYLKIIHNKSILRKIINETTKIEAWQDLPVMVMTPQQRPRLPMAMSFSVASPTMA